MLVATEILLLGRSVLIVSGWTSHTCGGYVLEFERAELLVNDLPYYLVGCHGEYRRFLMR